MTALLDSSAFWVVVLGASIMLLLVAGCLWRRRRDSEILNQPTRRRP